jgi:hypothetical protein
MEAPKKLYVDTEDRLSDSILYGFTKKRKEDDIEYVRTDALIEKAVDYIKKDMLDNLAFQGRLNRIKIIDGIIDKFIKAMKGG